MSHVVTIKTALKDIEAIKAACKSLGLTFVVGQTTYKWWGRHAGDYPLPTGFKAQDLGKCKHAIKVPGTQWEIGVTRARNADGSLAEGYTLLCDFFGPQGAPIAKALGPIWVKHPDGTDLDGRDAMHPAWAKGVTFNRFTQAYAVEKAAIEAMRQGWLVSRTTQADGTVVLNCTGM